jgi:hypothetical protein
MSPVHRNSCGYQCAIHALRCLCHHFGTHELRRPMTRRQRHKKGRLKRVGANLRQPIQSLNNGESSHQAGIALNVCPDCFSVGILRSHRHGFRGTILKLLWGQRYRCRNCGAVFYRFRTLIHKETLHAVKPHLIGRMLLHYLRQARNLSLSRISFFLNRHITLV